MPDTAVAASAAAQTDETARRKPWLAPEIEDVSVAMKTAVCHASGNSEYQSSKNGS